MPKLFGSLFHSACAAAVATAALAVTPAHAAEYPDHPIRAIIPYDPGGPTDLFARIFAPAMGKELHQTVIIENKPGGTGNLGMQIMTEGKTDGYTVLFSGVGTTQNPALFHKLPYDPIKDVQPVAWLAEADYMPAVNAKKFPTQNLLQFIEYGKANPGKLNFAAGGSGGRLNAEMFRFLTGMTIEIIAYSGGGDAVTSVSNGETDAIITDPSPLGGPAASGRVRLLAVTGEHRLPKYPDVPTFDEAGLTGFSSGSHFGVYVKAGTPKEVVQKLNEALNRSSKTDEVTTKLNGLGLISLNRSVEEFEKFYQADITRWKDLAAHAKIQMLD